MADSGESGGDVQITFKVKCSNDKIHTITMPESATVLDLKTKLAGSDFEDTPVERQRLIYSGRIMKDSDALSVYKIKNMNTIHMVKSARSNPTPAASSAASTTPTPPAVPQNMASGSSASDLLAGLTGARFAGHANLPSADLFGADGGMGAPPSEEQMAEMLSNPMIAQTMNEALNNPNFIDYMIRSNPALASMPNAREMLQSPYFRQMMTNPEAIHAPSAGNSATASNNTDQALRALFGAPGASGGPFAPGANPFASLLGIVPPAGPSSGAAATTQGPSASNPAASPENQNGPTGSSPNAQGQAGNAGQPFNPFSALFGQGQPGGAQGANASNPFALPPISPEVLQQVLQSWGLASPAATTAPQDNRPPEERYAEQLRQLNDMGFFDFERNVTALRRSGGSVQGAVEYLLSNP
ncbi:cbe5fdb9-9501-481f-ab78-75d5ba1676c2 [Thermothielavioides terrestris]|uniref:Cbe5fdb9-9501-481f-ab78-75d5ba1676c2 n=1 Tax=Thermothielavioides terrestris TaxID=2587410 RepID=A0A446B670_9PEZI|nr:cbe5fdb9-9501-481f-ab78-75d5ba1676c2 [Thermothielavioides terrestris]